jgi:ABC-type uncharacterized transport system substrate-binding protein
MAGVFERNSTATVPCWRGRNGQNKPGAISAIEAVAPASKYVLRRLNIADGGFLQAAFDAAVQERLHGIVVLPSPLVLDNRARIAALAMERKLPTVFLFTQAVEAGGLIAYGPDVNEMSRRAARLLIRVLNGAQTWRVAH